MIRRTELRLRQGAAAGVAMLLLTVCVGIVSAVDDQPQREAPLALLQAWAQGGNERAAGLAYVELSAARRPPHWRFLRIVAKREKVDLLGVASHATTAADCRLERRRLTENRKAVAGILAASVRALALPQDASALERPGGQRRALVFTDECDERNRTFAEPLSAALRALFGQLGTLTDRVFREGALGTDDLAAGKPIGSATMRRNGLLVFDLVAESSSGGHGLVEFVYPETDKDYARMLVHIGGICPGDQGRIVPSWPDCDR